MTELRSSSTSRTDGGGDLGGEAAQLVGVVGAEDEGAGAVLEGEGGEAFGHHGGAALEVLVAAEDVEHPPHGLRTATRLVGGLVDDGVHLAHVVGGDVAQAGQPAVGEPTGQPQHPRLEGAEPDLHVVHGHGAGVHPLDPVEVTVDVDGPVAVHAPGAADDRDAFLQRLDRLAGGATRPAHGDDRVPERPGAQAELGPAVADDVEGRHGLGEHRRRAEGQVRDVRGDPHRRRTGGDGGEERPGVEVLGLVRVVLHRDQLVPQHVGELGQLEGARGGDRVGGEEDAELQVMAVVGHAARVAKGWFRRRTGSTHHPDGGSEPARFNPIPGLDPSIAPGPTPGSLLESLARLLGGRARRGGFDKGHQPPGPVVGRHRPPGHRVHRGGPGDRRGARDRRRLGARAAADRRTLRRPGARPAGDAPGGPALDPAREHRHLAGRAGRPAAPAGRRRGGLPDRRPLRDPGEVPGPAVGLRRGRRAAPADARHLARHVRRGRRP